MLAVATSQVLELYAELSCDGSVPESGASHFAGHPVRVRLTVDTWKLYIDSPSAGTIEFTVMRVWAKE